MGWTLDQWRALPDREKDWWLAYDLRQDRALNDWREALTSSPDKAFFTSVVATLLRLAKLGL